MIKSHHSPCERLCEHRRSFSPVLLTHRGFSQTGQAEKVQGRTGYSRLSGDPTPRCRVPSQRLQVLVLYYLLYRVAIVMWISTAHPIWVWLRIPSFYPVVIKYMSVFVVVQQSNNRQCTMKFNSRVARLSWYRLQGFLVSIVFILLVHETTKGLPQKKSRKSCECPIVDCISVSAATRQAGIILRRRSFIQPTALHVERERTGITEHY